MKFGVALYPSWSAERVIAAARLAEELGYDNVWVGDSHMLWREVWVLLGAIASVTRRLMIGTGVTHPTVRDLSVTASAIATLAELAPNRVRLGIGVGASGPANAGCRRASLGELEGAIASIRTFLDGEPVSSGDRAIRLAYASGSVPVFVAGIAASTLRLGGRTANGAIFAGPMKALGSAREWIDEGEATASRQPGSTSLVFWTPVAVSEHDARARDSVRPIVARTALVWLRQAARTKTIDPIDVEPMRELAAHYDFARHMQSVHSPFVESRWIDEFAAAGSAELVRERCRSAARSGADEFTAIFPEPDLEGEMTRFARLVMEPLR